MGINGYPAEWAVRTRYHVLMEDYCVGLGTNFVQGKSLARCLSVSGQCVRPAHPHPTLRALQLARLEVHRRDVLRERRDPREVSLARPSVLRPFAGRSLGFRYIVTVKILQMTLDATARAVVERDATSTPAAGDGRDSWGGT